MVAVEVVIEGLSFVLCLSLDLNAFIRGFVNFDEVLDILDLTKVCTFLEYWLLRNSESARPGLFNHNACNAILV